MPRWCASSPPRATGTRVPVNIIMKKGTRLDGRNPLLLYGHGGFGISLTPTFAGAFKRLWLDAGGIYAEANIRGGSEYGKRYHQQGMLTHKQNDFDDFYAAARHLIDRRYTSSAKLALEGASSGGLLMGTHDGRVNPMHSRKFAAALRAATSSDRPILLRVDTS